MDMPDLVSMMEDDIFPENLITFENSNVNDHDDQLRHENIHETGKDLKNLERNENSTPIDLSALDQISFSDMESDENAELSMQVSGEFSNDFNIAESGATSADNTEIPQIVCISSNASENLNVAEVNMF